jgi:hypothetical protein
MTPPLIVGPAGDYVMEFNLYRPVRESDDTNVVLRHGGKRFISKCGMMVVATSAL